MLDMNNVELRTGQVVEITGSYRTYDDGHYIVTKSPGDRGWSGTRHLLMMCSESGEVKNFRAGAHTWPICVSDRDMPDPRQAAEARAWNEAHARIEVKATVDMAGLMARFRSKRVARDLA